MAVGVGEHTRSRCQMRCHPAVLIVSVAAAATTTGATAGARPNIVFIQTVRAPLYPHRPIAAR